MALPLFNGVVKSGHSEKHPYFFQSSIGKCLY